MKQIQIWWGLTCLIGLSIVLAHNTDQEPNTSFSNDTLSLQASSTWCDVSLDSGSNIATQEKSVCVEKLDIKSKEAAKLKSIKLSWSGQKLKEISGALYVKRKPTDRLVPIQKNFVCDGIWDSEQQTFTFQAHHKIVAVETLYLVLSFPRELEAAIHDGTFVLPEDDGVELEDV